MIPQNMSMSYLQTASYKGSLSTGAEGRSYLVQKWF